MITQLCTYGTSTRILVFTRSDMREFKGKSGIYKISNVVNGKVYIGKTKDFYKRYSQYVSAVKSKNKNQMNEYLLNSFIKYGFDSFKFEVVEFCDLEEIANRELHWILQFNSLNKEIGYNIRLDSSTGMITHPETSIKISNRLKEEWASGVRDGHSDKIKESWKSRDRDEQSRIMSKALTKYKYIVTRDGVSEVLLYNELLTKGLGNSISSFHRKKTNTVVCKGYIVERILI